MTYLETITQHEVLQLALTALGAKATRLVSRGKDTKANRNKVKALNIQRVEIARELYHAHRISEDELYLDPEVFAAPADALHAQPGFTSEPIVKEGAA
tara:strand:+ start:454 stop:747 length:294 start_codon:yes stop_codon:yes gene_type:complete